MNVKTLIQQLEQYDASRREQAKRKLPELAKSIAEAESVSDEMLDRLDATLTEAGVSRSNFVRMLELVERRETTKAQAERLEAARPGEKYDAARRELDAVLKEGEPLRYEIGESEAKRAHRNRKDLAHLAVAATRHAVSQLAGAKENATKVEAEYMAVFGQGVGCV